MAGVGGVDTVLVGRRGREAAERDRVRGGEAAMRDRVQAVVPLNAVFHEGVAAWSVVQVMVAVVCPVSGGQGGDAGPARPW